MKMGDDSELSRENQGDHRIPKRRRDSVSEKMPHEKDFGHRWLFDRGRGKGQDSPSCRVYHTLWGTLEFSPFSHAAALGHQLFMFCLWVWASCGYRWFPAEAWPGLFITCHKTCCLGVFSTLDSVSPTGDWFQRCLRQACAGSSWGLFPAACNHGHDGLGVAGQQQACVPGLSSWTWPLAP